MPDKIEEIISMVYKTWRGQLRSSYGACPEEETFALFLEGLLPEGESQELKKHFLGCDRCLEVIALSKEKVAEITIPQELIESAKKIVIKQKRFPALDIILGFKEKIIDIIETSGDVLFGQELAPLPVLRSRNIKDFGQEVLIIKNLDKIKTEIEVENKGGFNARVIIKISDINTSKPIEDLRITLIRDKQEIESYIVSSGKAVFDNVAPDKYSIEISSTKEIVGKILLEIKRI